MLKRTPKLTERQALDRVERLAAMIRNAATRLPDGPGESAQRVARGERDFWFFLRTYFPHYATHDSADAHYELVTILSEPGVDVVQMPRGWAKTTVFQIFTAWGLLYRKKRFAVIIGKSAERAQDSVLTLATEFEENERLIQDFGEQKGSRWSYEKGLRLKNGGWLIGIGRGESVRGLKRGPWRPDIIGADDIEDEELVRNPARVKQLLKWWLQAVLPALAIGGTAVWLCTSLSQKSPSTLLMDPEWTYDDAEEPPLCRRFSYPALNPEGESTWPAMWPIERLMAKKAQIGTTAFNAEYLHKSENPGGMFQARWFGDYDDAAVPPGTVTVISCDPSARNKDNSDCKAVLVISKDLAADDYLVRRAWIRTGEKATLTAFCEAICDCYMDFGRGTGGVRAVILEVNGFQELVADELIRVANRRGLRLPLVTIEQHINKEVRIQGLQPLAENGQIKLCRRNSDQGVLLEQLIYFPSSTVKDDGPDALEMGIDYLRPLRKDSIERGYKTVRKRADLRGAL